MPRGGGAPFFGEQRQVQVVSGNYAWNVPVAAANAPAPAAAPDAQLERMLALWATSQGVVKAAMMNNATSRSAKGGTEASFTVGGRILLTGLGLLHSEQFLECFHEDIHFFIGAD